MHNEKMGEREMGKIPMFNKGRSEILGYALC
jgi:hypothetical protein